MLMFGGARGVELFQDFTAHSPEMWKLHFDIFFFAASYFITHQTVHFVYKQFSQSRNLSLLTYEVSPLYASSSNDCIVADG
jgi:hypothetical protein